MDIKLINSVDFKQWRMGYSDILEDLEEKLNAEVHKVITEQLEIGLHMIDLTVDKEEVVIRSSLEFGHLTEETIELQASLSSIVDNAIEYYGPGRLKTIRDALLSAANKISAEIEEKTKVAGESS